MNAPDYDPEVERIVEQGDEEAKRDLIRYGSPAIKLRETLQFGAVATSVRDWRPAQCLVVMRQQINSLNSNRDKHDDGMIGDMAHASRLSDHNPWVDIKNGVGVVTAYDITHNPRVGCDGEKIATSLVASRDARIRYVIWNRHIFNSESVAGFPPWAQRPYKGLDDHTGHVHVSVLPTKALYDSVATWQISVG